MKRFIALLFLLPVLCFGQAAHRISQVIIKGNGIAANVSPGSKILVCVLNTGCATAANIYLDAAMTTPAHNPITADGSGNYDYYIASGCVDEQISAPGQGTIFLPHVCPFNGQSGGGGGNPAPPQYAVQFAGPSAAAFNADGTFTFTPSTHAVAALLTNGSYNTDPAETSTGANNGLSTLEAGVCAGGGCIATFPATTTSTESRFPTVSNTVVQDYKGGGIATYFYNPSPLGAAGYNPSGSKPAAGLANFFNYDAEQLSFGAQNQVGTNETYNFNAPGWSWGTNSNVTGFGLWSAQHGRIFTMNDSTPGIGQYLSGNCNKYSIGDSACLYIYNHPDAGFTSPSDEGADGLGVQLRQNATWFHGQAAAGATTGTQTLPTIYVSGTYSRTAYAVGGYMIDKSRAVLSFASVTGASTQMPNSGPWSFPVSSTVVESTAWGVANAAIPTPIDPTTASTDTVAFTVTGGTNAGGYTTGIAWLDGAEHMEQVKITAVTPISSGVQSITFTHRYPNTQAGTYLFQGGTNGFLSTYIYSISSIYGGWSTGYPVFGAIDSSHLVGRFASVTNYPIPSFYAASTTNVQLANLSVSGTTVTANINSQVAHYFDGLASAIISGASNSAFNGTVTNVHVINDAQLQWTQTVTGTSGTALISYPANYYQFNLYPGAEVTQPPSPMTPTVVPLEPNGVAWTSGDSIENVQQASFRGSILTGNMYVASPDSQLQNGIGGIGISVSGPGVSGAYSLFSSNNQNSSTMYQGGGGLLSPPVGINFNGPMSTALSMAHAPLDHSSAISVGCSYDGCGTTNTTNLISVNFGAGTFSYFPATTQFFLTSVLTPKIQANILSTGDGKYQNGGVSGVPVALTAASSAQSNNYSSLGNYAMFGNEGLLDTSADIGAHAFYAGTLYAGAVAPTGIGVFVNGTTGSSAYSYEAVSNTQNGTSVASASISTSTGNATLSATNNNTVDFVPGKGAQSIDVYRTAAPGGYSLGRICTAVTNLNAGGLSPCKDTGQATTGTLPTTDTSGLVQSATGTFGSLTVTGAVTAGSLATTQTPAASTTASDHSIPIVLNGTTYYIRLSTTP